jgi:predicted transporter
MSESVSYFDQAKVSDTLLNKLKRVLSSAMMLLACLCTGAAIGAGVHIHRKFSAGLHRKVRISLGNP